MSRAVLGVALLVAGLATVPSAQGRIAPAPGVAHRASVLVIVLDDVGKEAVQATCQNLNAFAQRGLTLERFYSFPVCSPTRYAALTGRYPRSVGMGYVVDAFEPVLPNPSPAPPREQLTLAERLKPTHSTLLVGKWHLGQALPALDQPALGPFVQGWDHWYAGTPNSVANGAPVGTSGYYDWYRVDDGAVQPHHSRYATGEQRDAFLGWWRKTRGPRFAWLAFNAAHEPYDTPPGYPVLNPLDPHKNWARHLQVVDYLDEALAEVLSVVDLDDTYVLIFSDNGLPDDARPLPSPPLRHKGTTYEGGVCVPAFLAGPGIAPGSTDRLASCLDVPATLCELLGLEQAWPDSRSLLSATPREWVFTESYGGYSGRDDVAVIEADWKYRRWDPDGPGPDPEQEALYRLSIDPDELSPLLPADEPEAYARLLARLASLPRRL